ncbi:zinc finger domain-containing protein [Mycobacterium sp. WMMD1722]|uniref:zinc finger domain-containing protein n=1 Tax=Mycobacterium sp. WMMD1722 TaxID=3404117 RepID=UPI003BF4749A
MTTEPHPALAHLCPFCRSQPTVPCSDILGGRPRAVGPHLSRIAAAVDPHGVRGRESNR